MSETINKQQLAQQNNPDKLYELGNIKFNKSWDYKQALKHYLKCIQILKNNNQQSFIQSIKYLQLIKKISICYYETQQYQKASEYFCKLLKIIQNCNDYQSSDNYYQIVTKLAICYKELQKYMKAVEYFSRQYKVLEKKFGKDSTQLLYVLQDLGDIFSRQKKYQQALKFYKHILKIVKKQQNASESKVAFKITQIAKIYGLKGDLTKAIQLEKKSLKMLQQYYGHDQNINTQSILLELAWTYINIGDYNQAKKTLEKRLKIQQEWRNQDYIQLRSSFYTLSITQTQLKNYNQSIALCQKNLKLMENDQQYYLYNFTLNNLGNNYRQLKQYNRAIDLYLKCLLSGRKNQNQETYYNHQIGYTLFLQNQFEKCKEYYQKAKIIYEKNIIIKTNPEHGVFLFRLAKLKKVQKKFDKAKQMLIEAKRICQKRYGKSCKNNYYLEILQELKSLNDI